MEQGDNVNNGWDEINIRDMLGLMLQGLRVLPNKGIYLTVLWDLDNHLGIFIVLYAEQLIGEYGDILCNNIGIIMFLLYGFFPIWDN